MGQGHIVITGPSGSGKSTLAAEVSKQTGLPLVKLDDMDEWKEFVQKRHGLSAEAHEELYLSYCKIMTEKALNIQERSVIEGQQFLKMESIPAGHNFICINKPKDVVVQQRVARSIMKEMARNGKVAASFIEQKTKDSEYLYDESYMDMKRLKLV